MAVRHSLATLPLLAALPLAAGQARGQDIQWGNSNGGSFHVGTNWIGGAVPGASDSVLFSRTRSPNQQLAYIVSFSSSPSNTDLQVAGDRVTLDLNGNAYLLSNPQQVLRIGTSSLATGRLTLIDGVVATTTPDAEVAIGAASNMAGVLTVSTGAQLLGPSVVVGYTGPGTLVLQNGGDLVGGPMNVGSGAPGAATVTGVGSAMVVESLRLGSFASGTLNINAGGRLESTSGSVGGFPDALGTVNIDGAGSRWTSSGLVYVGESGPGALNISNSGRAQVSVMIAASREDSTGAINVSGGGELISQGVCLVGGDGSGTMSVRSGGLVQSLSGGVGGDGQGTVTIDGAGSRWLCSGPMTVPVTSGDGSLTITAGGEVASTDGLLAGNLGSTGSASVSGTGSRWLLTGKLSVEGVLAITAGGAVRCTDGLIADYSGRVASVNVTGAGSRWAVLGNLSVGGNIEDGAIGSIASVTIGSGATLATNRVFLFPGATVDLVGGTLEASTLSFAGASGGRINILSGVLQAGLVGFNLRNLGAKLAPGPLAGRTYIDASYTQFPTATMEIEIGGTEPGTQFDQVSVSSTASLDGTLDVRLINGFVPSPGQTFVVLNAGVLIPEPGITGSFANAANGQRLAITGGGGSFIVNYGPDSPFGPDQVVLSDFNTCRADFNGDGFLDFFDYIDYVTCFESGVCPPGKNADFNSDGFADFFDYLDFVTAFESGC